MNVLFRSFGIVEDRGALEGAEIYLRSPRSGDWTEWAKLRAESRDFLVPWEPAWPPDALTRMAFRRRLRRYARESRDDQGYAFFIFRSSDHALLGGLTLSNIRRGIAQSCSMGYWVGKRHARQGHMSEALQAVFPFIFDDLGLRRLEAACLPNNEASKSLLRKVGFTQEGYAREYLCINGTWSDHLLFALLKSDVRGRAAKPAGRPDR
jgi:ribosomal-protein-alanine N-acetyltransferase